ncbi:MAG TPA: nickel-dependent hydrogenase large subunit, partial [Aquifex aeolicus]|nr:nickel-dependent hydrogenase large subunit [Aquifex aeolicus]
VVDPVTRIEGHLRVEVVVDETNKTVKDAISSATMWRGIEVIIKGRDPRDAWAFAQRICGVCTSIHALASVRAVEDALDIQIPKNANYIRNIMLASLYVHDHVVHFYHLHSLDWVSPIEALNADPVKTAELQKAIINKYGKIVELAKDYTGLKAYARRFPKATPAYFKAIKDKIKQIVDSGQLGIFAPANWWHHPDYKKLPPEVHLMAIAHYLEMLDLQREFVIPHVVFGGKNPHPHYLVGGMNCSISLDDGNAPINTERLGLVQTSVELALDAVNYFYILDLLAIADIYLNKHNWFYGGGLAKERVLGFGDFPDESYRDFSKTGDYWEKILYHANGIVHNFKDGVEKAKYEPFTKEGIQHIAEYVQHSFYHYEVGDNKPLHPWEGETTPAPEAVPETPWKFLDPAKKYSYSKTPVYKGMTHEVGPLARYIVTYTAVKQGHITPSFVDEMIVKQIDMVSQMLGIPAEKWLLSTVGRTLARGLEAQVAANLNTYFLKKLYDNIKAGDTKVANNEKFDPETWGSGIKRGVGFAAAPRGGLSHWIVINGKTTENYQAIVPSTWNVAPRLKNEHGEQRAAYEAAMLDTEVKDARHPLEIIRTVHSFDPCLACATHIYNTEGEEITQFNVNAACAV